MNKRNELIELIKSGKTVTINLNKAEVVFSKRDLKPINHYCVANLYKFIVKDPVFGSIFFSGFSSKLADLNLGDMISLKVTVTGVGDPSERYPDPIVFAKPHTRKGDSITVDKPIVFEPDLTVNV